jgi:hypothetical protein
MADVNQNGSDQDEAPKQRARDLNMDELERSANITGSSAGKNWIWALIGVVVVGGGVTVGVVLSQGGTDNDRALPTRAPTFLTPEPTPWPVTEFETDDPTFDDISTPSPTSFRNVLPPYSLDIASRDDASPQAWSLYFLQEDIRVNGDYEPHRLRQRYALRVLYNSTNGYFWKNKTGWESHDDECTWYQFGNVYPCIEGSRLAVLDLQANGLDGTIPTELELLADLQSMQFYGDETTLSVAIYPEL